MADEPSLLAKHVLLALGPEPCGIMSAILTRMAANRAPSKALCTFASSARPRCQGEHGIGGVESTSGRAFCSPRGHPFDPGNRDIALTFRIFPTIANACSGRNQVELLASLQDERRFRPEQPNAYRALSCLRGRLCTTALRRRAMPTGTMKGRLKIMKARTFIVTGGVGFIGSAVVRYLIQQTSYDVCIVDNLLMRPAWLPSAPFLEIPLKLIRADVTDTREMAKVLAEWSERRPAFGGRALVDRSIDGPLAFIQTNVIGTFALLQAALAHWRSPQGRSQETFLFHHVSTDEVYGSLGDEGAFTEESPYQPNSPYSGSKASSDHLVLIAEKGRVGDNYNVGGGAERRNIDVVRAICAVLDRVRPSGRPHARLITFVHDRPGHDWRYATDASKIRNELGWRPRESFEIGIASTVEWYLQNRSWWEAVRSGRYQGERLGLAV